jgi:hypothetical protein
VTPIFVKTNRERDVLLSIDLGPGLGGPLLDDKGEYLDISKPLTEKQLLAALSHAYSMGFESAHREAGDAVRRVLYERKRPYAPNPKVVKKASAFYE